MLTGWLAIAAPVCVPTTSVARDSATVVVAVADSELRVESRGGRLTSENVDLATWVRRSATIVRGYYGYFPLASVTVRVTFTDGTRVITGHTSVWPHAVIDVTVGRDVTAAALLDDWILIHEMIHLALPEVGDEHNWLAEGLATYVEGVARVQAGNMAADRLWAEYVAQMPRGLPGTADRGLDHTHTWARTYWGGALYCLQADVSIRVQTQGRRGLRDALQVIGRDSGGMRADWSIAKVLATGDAATGTHVLTDLYSEMKDAPTEPDLGALWEQLGIQVSGDQVRLNDDAPLATVRRAITTP